MTLFVLVLSMRGKTMTATEFWRRRFGLVLWPPSAQRTIILITDHRSSPPATRSRTPAPGSPDLGMDLIGGTGKCTSCTSC